MTVEGPQWGMGCNSIHFMDLFSHLTQAKDFHLTETELNNNVPRAKRTGFNEFFGRIAGKDSHGNTLELSCFEIGEHPTTVKIHNGSTSFQISGLLGNVALKTSSKSKNHTDKFFLPYQSQLTHIWAKDILENGSCDLPTYADSMPLHLELIRVLTDHLEKVTGKGIDSCPIT